MKIIKEVCTASPVTYPEISNTWVVLRTNTYAKSVDHIMTLVNEAKADFPSIQYQDIQIVVYGGERYKHTMGIEFKVNREDVPSAYNEISTLEYTLG